MASKLPDPVRRFCYEAAALQPHERYAWGVVMTDPRYPDLWDANNAAVLEPDPSLGQDRIRTALLPALEEAGAPTEHIEFWETSEESPALRELRARGEERTPDLVMVFEGAETAGVPPVDLTEVTDPDRRFLAWYRSSLNEFGTQLSEGVLDQLVRRILDVFLPTGMRWFVGSVDGRPAGYTSLVSLGGVGYLDNVVTMPEFRRRGVATATVVRAVQASLCRGDGTVFLLAEEGGTPRRLYERLGFRVAARVESFTRPLTGT